MAVLHMLKSATDTICESFIFEDNGRLLVVDGGFESEAESLYSALRELGGRVEAWFITHPHAMGTRSAWRPYIFTFSTKTCCAGWSRGRRSIPVFICPGCRR